MNAKDKNTSQLNLKIDLFLHRRLKAAAAMEGVSMTELIERILSRVVEDDEEPKQDKRGKA
ncbi:MAG: toxin-antitoxin system HicB family antitoxin [Lentisphaerae bacterium]|nr:toxin-antitoxin system HicB family antitoxin [Lentisphaerota bacterium]